jgi:hypothetical protein
MQAGDSRNAAQMVDLLQDIQDALNNIPVESLRPNALHRKNFALETFDMGVVSDTLSTTIASTDFVPDDSTADVDICTVEFDDVDLNSTTQERSAFGVLVNTMVDARRCTSCYMFIDGVSEVPEAAAVIEFWIEARLNTTWYVLTHTQRFIRCNEIFYNGTTFPVTTSELDYELRRNVPIATLITKAALQAVGALGGFTQLNGVRVRCRGWLSQSSRDKFHSGVTDPNFDIAAGSHLVVSLVSNGQLEIL